MTNKEKALRILLSPVNASSVWAVGLYTLIWGLWVASPFWGVFEHAQIFSTLGLVAPEVFWGLFAVTCGLLTIAGAMRKSARSLMMGANVAWFHWTMIAIFYLYADWHNTGGISSLMIASYAAYIWLNLQVNRKWRGIDDDHLIR